MANNKSAEKRVRQIKKRTECNRRVKSQMRTAIKRFEESLSEDNSATEASLRAAIKQVDKAAQKGVIHKNKAARKKSRLSKRLNALKAE